MRKITTILLLLTSLLLTGCTQETEPPYTIYDAKDELVLSNEIEDITLPDSYQDFDLSWKASKSDFLDGYQVIQDKFDTSVLFTVTITDDENSTTKNFEVIVLRSDEKYEEYIGNLSSIIEQEANAILDIPTSITTNVYLPTLSNGISIVWSSNNEDVISTSGEVTQPEYGSGSKIVTLTAVFTYEEVSKQYELIITVLPKELDDNSAQYAIYQEYINQFQLPYTEVIGDINLPSMFGTYDVVWSSSNETFVSNEGTITRPTFEEGNQTVTLEATFLYLSFADTKAFTITVLALEDPDVVDQELLDVLTDEFLFTYSSVDSDLFLPTSYEVSSILWTSSNLNFLSHTGVVTRPTFEEGNQEVTLSATFTYNNADVVKEFVITILAESATYMEYYQGVEGLEGDALKSFLHDLIDDHTMFSYTSLWDALSETDEDPNNPDNVILLYTGRSQDKDAHGGNADDWNREHVWAKSHGDFGNLIGPGTDMHHIRPTDSSINSTRSNLDFDNGGNPVYDGGILTDNLRDSDSWEPRDEVKGDVARMIFYMAVRYEGDDGYPDLELNDLVNNSGPYMGRISVLIEWHLQDPPDEFEMNRNDVIFSFQGNRNPFIDYPELVELIWGD